MVTRKINITFLLASWKALILKFVPKAAPNFFSGFPWLSLVDFLTGVHSFPAFRNRFQNQRRLTEQLLESQTAIRMPEQAP
jgi:hypothetical protein